MALEMWNGSVWVTVATGIEPDVAGHRRDPRGDQHGVGPAGEPARLDLGTAAPLRGERVVERHEVQQPAFGGGRRGRTSTGRW